MSAYPLLLNVFTTNGIGFVIGMKYGPSPRNPEIKQWYDSLKQAPGTPPNWLFGPMWTFLYCSMSLASYIIAFDGGIFAKYGFGKMISIPNEDERAKLKYIYLTHLVLNNAWTPLFFGSKKMGLALVDILSVLGCIIYLQGQYKKYNALCGKLMIPYICWVSYASYLNAYNW
eukprot:CAMPEP_0202692064 /NCGR_PEP_ID=MMETSP1385-20130828/6552_1 /ASSEMBLY_ACC=CAM_ASM_000861 /TAXON_ID=933848 /ORGANISM="Elphidium margaritaceum" /LENGTH=171 /DNA_ID=CAMNT_0049347537 /DNA_START=23 /DNA_END=535 /DNA_ORIENTATION=-